MAGRRKMRRRHSRGGVRRISSGIVQLNKKASEQVSNKRDRGRQQLPGQKWEKPRESCAPKLGASKREKEWRDGEKRKMLTSLSRCICGARCGGEGSFVWAVRWKMDGEISTCARIRWIRLSYIHIRWDQLIVRTYKKTIEVRSHQEASNAQLILSQSHRSKVISFLNST